MPTDPRLLTLAQWLSPAYPLGSFAYSHGLEAAVAEGWVSDASTLETWLEGVLEHGTGRSDAILLRLAHTSDAPEEIDTLARAFAPSRERLLEAEAQGAAFARTTAELWAIDLPPLVFPVAVGRAARLMALDIDATTALYLQSFTANLVAAAQRLAPVGQTEGQRIVASFAPLCLGIAEDTQGATEDDLTSTAFLSDIASMRHETLSPRIFQS